MAKQGFTLSRLPTVLKNVVARHGWALCVGAGTSQPLFPSWNSLVSTIMMAVDSSAKPEVIKSVLANYTPDAVIQAAQDRLGIADEDYIRYLTEHMFFKAKTTLSKKEWSTFTRVLSSRHLRSVTRSTWTEYSDLLRAHFGDVSATQIAPVLASAIVHCECPPSEILSFNAETLLLSILNSEIVSLIWDPDSALTPTDKVVRVTHSITTRRPGRIPYYMCHGMLPVPHGKKRITSTDKLVFSESAYLTLANSAFSWQSASFLDIAMSRSMVFIGVSLTDSNMRRWLSWVQSNRISEIRHFGRSGDLSAIHYWIRRAPGSISEKRWIESTVAHLGVRVVWLDEWTQVGDALRKMLGQSENMAKYAST